MIFVGIIYASCEPSSFVLHEFRVNQRSNRFFNPELILFGLGQNLVFEIKKMLLLSMHCIAYAFGKFGYTNEHLHENSVPPLPLSIGDVVTPYPKVSRRNLGYRVCCSHTTATRSALGILVVR
jgi:hypothetical protein